MNENLQDEMDKSKNSKVLTDSEIECESSMEDMIFGTGRYIESVDIRGKLTAGEKIYFNDEMGGCRLRICGFSEEQMARAYNGTDVTLNNTSSGGFEINIIESLILRCFC